MQPLITQLVWTLPTTSLQVTEEASSRWPGHTDAEFTRVVQQVKERREQEAALGHRRMDSGDPTCPNTCGPPSLAGS
jgi:hypothetical protein